MSRSRSRQPGRRQVRGSEADSAPGAFDVLVAALARSDLTSIELDRRLERAGFSETARHAALARADGAGYLDDSRVAIERAQRLADRGASDQAIRVDLGRRGVPPQAVVEALASLTPEPERAERLAARLGGGVRSGRTLVRKGFSQDAVDHALQSHIADGP